MGISVAPQSSLRQSTPICAIVMSAQLLASKAYVAIKAAMDAEVDAETGAVTSAIMGAKLGARRRY